MQLGSKGFQELYTPERCDEWLDVAKSLPMEMSETVADLVQEIGWVLGFLPNNAPLAAPPAILQKVKKGEKQSKEIKQGSSCQQQHPGGHLYVLSKLDVSSARQVLLQHVRVPAGERIDLKEHLMKLLLGAMLDPWQSTNHSTGPRRPFELELEFSKSDAFARPRDEDLVEVMRVLTDKLRVPNARYCGHKPSNARGAWEQPMDVDWNSNWFRVEMRLPVLPDSAAEAAGSYYHMLEPQDRKGPFGNTDFPTKLYAYRQFFGPGKLMKPVLARKAQAELAEAAEQTGKCVRENSYLPLSDDAALEKVAGSHVSLAESYLQFCSSMDCRTASSAVESARSEKPPPVGGAARNPSPSRAASPGREANRLHITQCGDVLTKHATRLFWNARDKFDSPAGGVTTKKAAGARASISKVSNGCSAVVANLDKVASGLPVPQEVQSSLSQTMRVCGYRPHYVVLAQPSVCGVERRHLYEDYFRAIDVVGHLGMKNWFEGLVVPASCSTAPAAPLPYKIQLDPQGVLWNMSELFGKNSENGLSKEKRKDAYAKASAEMFEKLEASQMGQKGNAEILQRMEEAGYGLEAGSFPSQTQLFPIAEEDGEVVAETGTGGAAAGEILKTGAGGAGEQKSTSDKAKGGKVADKTKTAAADGKEGPQSASSGKKKKKKNAKTKQGGA
eukprot:g11249.t1